ncbi:MAG: glycosyltransferase [Lachnospiraceae bacterium]|nr:glycosyltransferase [Lachnospiraceae bacterium]
MGEMMFEILGRVAVVLADLYHPGKEIGAVIAGFLSILIFHKTAYKILGFFFTRKFKPAKKMHKYGICIAARNEEAVIGNLLESIAQQDYKKELLTVFVVADNCDDRTGAIAREYGAVCYERFNKNERTKGYALKYLFEQIERDYGTQNFDGFFIFDADNLLKRDYISRMNDSFDEGCKIITSYRNTKNLSEGWIASNYALHWIRSIRHNHRARSVLKLATNIQGTGFLFASEIVKDGWKYTSLTEDRAFTADSVVEGYEITYNDAAVFYDEQPADLKVALRQRLRWSKGHLQAFGESGGKLFKHIFIDTYTKKEKGEVWWHYLYRTLKYRFMSFDTFAQLVPRNVIALFKWIVLNVILYPCFCMEVLGLDYLSSLTGVIVARLGYRVTRYFYNILTAVYLFLVEHRRIEKVSIWKTLLYCVMWPVFDIIGRYTQYAALFMKVEWKPIPHKSRVRIGDLKLS